MRIPDSRWGRLGGFLVLLTGFLFVGVGIWRGEIAVVFTKAVNLCLECIGIG